MSAPARSACLAVIILLTGFLIRAFASGDVLADQSYVWQRVWGGFIRTGVYAGFTRFSLIVCTLERRLGGTRLPFILTCALGSFGTAAWLLWRGPALARAIPQARNR